VTEVTQVRLASSGHLVTWSPGRLGRGEPHGASPAGSGEPPLRWRGRAVQGDDPSCLRNMSYVVASFGEGPQTTDPGNIRLASYFLFLTPYLAREHLPNSSDPCVFTFM
jgi:hypothetical protein